MRGSEGWGGNGGGEGELLLEVNLLDILVKWKPKWYFPMDEMNEGEMWGPNNKRGVILWYSKQAQHTFMMTWKEEDVFVQR